MEATSSVKIKKSVPIPNRRGNSKGYDRYPWRDMKVGDMFFVPTPDEMHVSVHQSSVCSATRIVRRQADMKGREFTTRQIEQNGKRGIGVWRVK